MFAIKKIFGTHPTPPQKIEKTDLSAHSDNTIDCNNSLELENPKEPHARSLQNMLSESNKQHLLKTYTTNQSSERKEPDPVKPKRLSISSPLLTSGIKQIKRPIRPQSFCFSIPENADENKISELFKHEITEGHSKWDGRKEKIKVSEVKVLFKITKSLIEQYRPTLQALGNLQSSLKISPTFDKFC